MIKQFHIKTLTLLGVTTILAGFFANGARADQQILDDLIVAGSACIGLDCVNGESFGFDTIRIKENNLRIKAQDTSTTASFPTQDWQITFNDSSNGGQNKFSIDAISPNVGTPFTIEASNQNHALYIDDGGKIGFGTSAPVVDLHVKSGNTPTLRLEQDGTSGFTAQTWDLAGNEANFFIRDATNGSTLPFRVQPSAPSNAIYIADGGGEVLMGTTSSVNNFDGNPAQLLVTGDGTAKSGTIIARNTGTTAERSMLELINNGGSYIAIRDTANNDNWFITKQNVDNGRLEYVSQLDGGGFTVAALLEPDGDMIIGGTLTELSDKNSKMAIEAINSAEVLQKVASLPIAEWTYKHNAAEGTRHIGPMAQDFYALFGVGKDDKGIATMDTVGVALAAIQALHAENIAFSARLTELENSVSD